MCTFKLLVDFRAFIPIIRLSNDWGIVVQYSPSRLLIIYLFIRIFGRVITNKGLLLQLIIIKQLHGIWKPEVQCHIHKGSPINPTLRRIDSMPCKGTYFLRYILILSSHLRLSLPKGLIPVGLPVKILKALLPSSILATWPALHFLI